MWELMNLAELTMYLKPCFGWCALVNPCGIFVSIYILLMRTRPGYQGSGVWIGSLVQKEFGHTVVTTVCSNMEGCQVV